MSLTLPMLPEAPPASLRLRIDTHALQANWRALDRLSGSASAGAAVKAQCYGLGTDQCIPALIEAGARDFFVAHWSEARDLLRFLPAENISVLHGVGNPAEAGFAIETGVVPVLNSLHQVGVWKAVGGGRCHVMVDTGMNRLGMAPSELASAACDGLEIDVLMSHLASADEDSPQNEAQLAAFRAVIGTRPARRLSLANSAGIALGADYRFDLTRPGIALYGGIPHSELEGAIAQVAYPETAVLQLRNIQAGDKVGYNARFTAPHAMRVATVSLGYADGFLRSRGPDCALHKDGREYPIIGRVSMDMVVVDCTGSSLAEGDFLRVPMDLPAAASSSGLSQYELLTVLGNRFDRVS